LSLIALYYATFQYFKRNLYLDAGLSNKHDVAKTENLTWLNQFGTIGTFLKNDIKLIKETSVLKLLGLSVMFLLRLLFFTGGIESYNNPVMHIFCWGFRFRWISNYFQTICTQLGQRLLPADDTKHSVQRLFEFEMVADGYCNNCYHNYCVYLYFGLHVYLTIVVAAIYNMESTLISFYLGCLYENAY
jgi:hypothetical protein